MRKCGHIRPDRPNPVTAQAKRLERLERLTKLRDRLCGIVEWQTQDSDGMTVHIGMHKTNPTRSLDLSMPYERKLHQEIERLEQSISPTAVQMCIALATAPNTEPDYVELQTNTWPLSEPLADHLATWSKFGEPEPPPSELCHLATVRTFSDTDPPQVPMPKHRTTNLDLAWVGYGQAKRALVTLCT